MRVSHSLLTQFVATPTSPRDLAHQFMMTSSEYEDILVWSEQLEHCHIGLVTACERHPNADRLQVASVDLGELGMRTIVCGGTNLAAGMRVIVALPGAVLHMTTGDIIKIADATIRGVASSGMICAPQELGLEIPSGNHEIWDVSLLCSDVALGTAAHVALGLSATLDLSITPNRPDLLSVYGLAREVATWERRPLAPLPQAVLSATSSSKLHAMRNKEAGERLSLMAAHIKPGSVTPWEIQATLLQAGIRCIHPAVDLAAYVMLVTGQPLHAYDADLLPSTTKGVSLKIDVLDKPATFTGLDGKERNLLPGDLVTVAGNGSITDLAGIMGGQDTAVHSESVNIIVKAAHLHGAQVRRTSRRLGLRTDASTRFEKGLDSQQTTTALQYYAHLLTHYNLGTTTGELIDTGAPVIAATPISMRFDAFKSVIGVRVQPHEIKVILESLGCRISKMSKSGLLATPPSWRSDIRIPEDLYEEVIRIWGYDRIPSLLISGAMHEPRLDQQVTQAQRARETLAGLGLLETLHIPFTSIQALGKLHLDPSKHIALEQPISSDQTHLISDHISVLLSNIAERNQDYVEGGIFEIGNVFSAPRSEETRLSLLQRTSEADPTTAYRTVKMYLEALGCSIRHETGMLEAAYATPGSTAQVYASDGTMIGHMCLMHSDVIQAHKIRRGKTLVYASISLQNAVLGIAPHFVAPAAYPSSSRDLTLQLADATSTPWSTIVAADATAQDLIRSAPRLITRYVAADGSVRLTIRYVFQADDRTLTEEEITTSLQRATAALTTLNLTLV
jgi:phenylalanyl-tRNA synthetase beta chain